MSEVQEAISVFASTLAASERPLSARRLLKLCADKPGLESWTVQGVETALREHAAFLEIRRGVFATLDYKMPIETVPPKALRSSRRVSEDSEGPSEIIFPDSMDEMVALRRQMGGRDALRLHLIKKLKNQSSEVLSEVGKRFDAEEGWSQTQIEHSEKDTVPPRRMIPNVPPASSKHHDERFVERRQAKVSVANERRKVDHGAKALSELGDRVQETLEASGRILSPQAIVRHLHKSLPTLDESGVRMAVFVDNERCRHLGLREPFVVREGEGIGLTSWGLPKRFMELEASIHNARTEQEELVKRALLHRLSDLSTDGFRQAVALVLERNGIMRLSNREVDLSGVGFLNAQQRRGTKLADVLVVLDQSWDQVDGSALSDYRAAASDAGSLNVLLITLGTFSANAVRESHREHVCEIQLIDGEALANLFYESKVGLKSATWTFSYPDLAFFKGLAED